MKQDECRKQELRHAMMLRCTDLKQCEGGLGGCQSGDGSRDRCHILDVRVWVFLGALADVFPSRISGLWIRGK